MTIASLIVDVFANTVKLQQDVNKIHGTLDTITATAAKMGAALGIGFSVGAVVNYAKAAFDAAGQVVDLSNKTGLSTRAIQEMSFVAAQTGTTLEAFTNAAFKLGTSLDGGTGGVRQAVDRLGLSYAHLRSLKPDEQFNLVVAALHKMESPQERNRTAIELFGKAAAQILPAIADDYAKIADGAVIAGDQQLKAIDEASDAWDRLKKNVQSTFIQMVGSAMLAYEQLGTGVETLTEKERAHLAFLKKSGGDYQAYLEEIAERHIALRLEQERVRLVSERQNKVYGELKALDIPSDIAVFELQYKQLERSLGSSTRAQEDMQRAHERFAESVQRLDTAEFFVQLKSAVHEASFELEELASTVPAIAQTFVPLKAAVQESSRNFITFGDEMRKTFEELPTVILKAIQGGGSVLRAAGAHIGTSMMESFRDRYGALLEDILPFGIGRAINALLPSLGALFGPVVEKIGGFFRNIFGGPSAEELRGRQAVADFEAQLHSLVSATDRAAAGNESWKLTVIAVRDAYLAAGRTEAEALAAVERLWNSSRNGAEAVQRAIDEINAVLRQTASTSNSTADSVVNDFDRTGQAVDDATRLVGQINDEISRIPTHRDLTVTTNYVAQYGPAIRSVDFSSSAPAMTNGLPPGTYDYNGDGRDENGWAMGTISTGRWFRNFGAGTRTVLHGEEAVVRKDQAGAFASAMGGESLAELRALRQEMRDFPRAVGVAVSDALALMGVR